MAMELEKVCWPKCLSGRRSVTATDNDNSVLIEVGSGEQAGRPYHGCRSGPKSLAGEAIVSEGEQIAETLLVEDNDGHAILIEAGLRESGLVNPVHRVHDGEEALAFVRREGRYAGRAGGHPSLIILDLDLPRIDGFEVLQRLKADSDYRLIPIVVLTTSVDMEDRNRCYELGCSAWFGKWPVFIDFPSFARELASLTRLVFRPDPSRTDA
jgi:CheY-like chemotaxis protein